MPEKEGKEPKFISFLWFAFGWIVIATILRMLPISFETYRNIYTILGLFSWQFSVTLYEDFMIKYLYFYYRESCNNAMRIMYQVPAFNDNEKYLRKHVDLRSFNEVVRKKIFEPIDDKILEIKRNNAYAEWFWGVIVFRIMLLNFDRFF